jgi:hypothetical protein
MCPACIENAAVTVAGVASTGGIMAVCIGRLKDFLSGHGLFRRKEK